jgi:hypothetical protein
VKKRTLSPVFNESFAFDIPITEGGGQTLEGVSLENFEIKKVLN